MEVSAKIKMIRIAPRKVRLVVDLIRGKKIGEAISILENTDKRSSKDIQKLVKSAAANAVNNNGMEADKLYINKVLVNEGPTIKRFNPRAHGRAFEILKRTSSVVLSLSDINKK